MANRRGCAGPQCDAFLGFRYLQQFPIVKMQDYTDWINLMTYVRCPSVCRWPGEMMLKSRTPPSSSTGYPRIMGHQIPHWRSPTYRDPRSQCRGEHDAQGRRHDEQNQSWYRVRTWAILVLSGRELYITHAYIRGLHRFYGRSFTLSNPSCNTAGCPMSGPGRPGPCTKGDGFLS